MRAFPPTLALAVLLLNPAALRAEDDALELRMQEDTIPVFPAGETVPVFIHADRINGHQDSEVKAEGDAELRRRGQVIEADSMTYYPPLDEVLAEGNVRVEQENSQATGPELRLNLETRQGYMREPKYRLAHPDAHGTAERLEFIGENKYLVRDGTFTTCGEGDDSWFMRAGELELDRVADEGSAHHASIHFKGVPLFYSPWLSFPLSDTRKSGFLSPYFGDSAQSGLEFALPYYWNIAPEQDATITPRVLSKRGVQLTGDYRYLNPDYTGNARAAILPDDRITDSSRWAVLLNHNQNLGSGWSGGLNYQRVSDDNYFRDLSNTVTSTSQINLPQQGVLAYHAPDFRFLAQAQDFQTLQDPLAPITPPYARLPQLMLDGTWRDMRMTDLGLVSEWVDFRHPTLVNGQRFTLYPNASFPVRRAYGFFTPKIGVNYTSYALGENNQDNLPDATRTLPIFSVDSGLYFDRDIQVRGNAFSQTLEPRLYYLYIPYQDQDNLPNFDTAVAAFNYAQLFTENQFVGGDRINNANRLTVALTSRLFESESGQERLRMSLGQGYYFTPQKVTLNGQGASSGSSDVLATLIARVTPAWSGGVGLQYIPDQQQFQQANLGARYAPAPGKVLNLSYRFTRDSLEQLDVSIQWPFATRWQGMARWNYSLQDSKVLEGLAGLEYNGGCWAARMVAHNFITATNQSSNSILFQLELSGLGKIGSNPLELLKRNIGGYAPTGAAQLNRLSTPDTNHERFY